MLIGKKFGVSVMSKKQESNKSLVAKSESVNFDINVGILFGKLILCFSTKLQNFKQTMHLFKQ